MTDEAEPKVGPEMVGPMNQEGLKQLLGWDTTRVWATGVQVFINPDHALFVLREGLQVDVETPDGETVKATVNRNVASFVLPLSVAQNFKDILQSLDFEAAKRGETGDA